MISIKPCAFYFFPHFAPFIRYFQFTSRLAALSDCRDALVLDDTTVVWPLAFILFHLSAKEKKFLQPATRVSIHLFAPAYCNHFTPPISLRCLLSLPLSFPFLLLASRIYGYFLRTDSAQICFLILLICIRVYLTLFTERSKIGGLYFGFCLLFHLKHTHLPVGMDEWHAELLGCAIHFCILSSSRMQLPRVSCVVFSVRICDS